MKTIIYNICYKIFKVSNKWPICISTLLFFYWSYLIGTVPLSLYIGLVYFPADSISQFYNSKPTEYYDIFKIEVWQFLKQCFSITIIWNRLIKNNSRKLLATTYLTVCWSSCKFCSLPISLHTEFSLYAIYT